MRGRIGVYTRMNELDARDYFARGEAPFSQQWYSAYVGGPIRRNALHYFGSFEGLRQDQTAVVTSPLMPGEYPQETRNIKFLTKLDYQVGSSQHLTFRYNFDGGHIDQQRGWRTQHHRARRNHQATPAGLSGQPDERRCRHASSTSSASSMRHSTRETAPVSSGRTARAVRRSRDPAAISARRRTSRSGTTKRGCRSSIPSSMTQGRHDLKAGVNYSYVWTDIYFPGTQDGAFVFTTDRPFNAADAATYPVRYDIVTGDPLAKIPDQLLALFVQDSWRARPNLTINAGLRYDWQGQHVVRNDKNNFGPRLSFTFDPDERRDVHPPGRGRHVLRPEPRRAHLVRHPVGAKLRAHADRQSRLSRSLRFQPKRHARRVAAGTKPDRGRSQQGHYHESSSVVRLHEGPDADDPDVERSRVDQGLARAAQPGHQSRDSSDRAAAGSEFRRHQPTGSVGENALSRPRDGTRAAAQSESTVHGELHALVRASRFGRAGRPVGLRGSHGACRQPPRDEQQRRLSVPAQPSSSGRCSVRDREPTTRSSRGATTTATASLRTARPERTETPTRVRGPGESTRGCPSTSPSAGSGGSSSSLKRST